MIDFIVQNADRAHWFVFGCILLAGFNVPLSIDLLVVLSAVLAATVIPEKAVYMFLAIYFGCVFSAWIAYGLGRFLGKKLCNIRWFKKLFPQERLDKMHAFYKKNGFWTLLVGRFIPFGVRNALFMTTGMSKLPFVTFILRDSVACLIWTSSTFFLFYALGQNYNSVVSFLKAFNLLIFSLFAVAVIGFFWYKRKKNRRKAIE